MTVLALRLGFDCDPVFDYPQEPAEVLVLDEESAQGLGMLGDASAEADFFALASQKLGGQVSAAEGQALQSMAGWGQDATSTLLANLDPSGQALFATAVQGVGDLSHGINVQTLSAVSALAASEIAGPVAGAAVGGLLAGIQVEGQALLGVAQALGIAATAPPIDQYCGWIDQTKGVLKPWGPSDKGDGTFANPGWIDSWDWISSRFVAVPLILPAMPSTTISVLPGLQTGNNGCSSMYTGPTDPLIAPQNVIGDANAATAICEYLQARALENSGAGAQFETLFVPLYFHNLDLANNCSPVAPLPLQVLLGKAVDVWNASHEPGTPRTISAETASQSLSYVPMIARVLGGDFGGNSLPPITLNTGPAIAPHDVIALPIPAGAAAASAPAATPSSSSSAAPAIAVVAAAGTAAGLWLYIGRPLTIAAIKAGLRSLFRR